MKDVAFPSLRLQLPRYSVEQTLGVIGEWLKLHGFTHSEGVISEEGKHLGFVPAPTGALSQVNAP